MNFRRSLLTAVLAATALGPLAGAWAAEPDIKRLALADAHTVVYAKHNPERDYQAEYLADAWKTFQDERIAERVFDIIASRAPEDKLADIQAAWSEVETALEPIDRQALLNAQEFMMFNVMVGPFGHALVAVRLSDADAKDYRAGVGNLFALVQKWSGEKVTAEPGEAAGAEITTLRLPREVPYQPAVACVGDLFVVCTSDELLKRSLAQLDNASEPSKFDDERFKQALTHLPAAEDSVTFFDGAQLFKNLHGIGDFIRQEKPDDEDAERMIAVLDEVIDQIDVLDYEAAVEYADDGQNRAAALGKFTDDMQDTLLGRAISKGEQFKDWQSWVPADAVGYSMSTGISLHELYVGVLSFVREEFPEAKQPLEQWDEMQERVGVNLDEDLLQAFTGESVSIALPNQQSVNAYRCTNEEKIRELMDRGIEGLKQIPQVAQQGLDLEDVDDAALDGFQQLKLAQLAMSPIKPVIGFRDGWMILATSPDAAKHLLAVRAGDEPSIAGAESLKRFNLKTDGTVAAVSYADIGAQIRQSADGIDQFAAMAPFVMAAATADASAEDRKTINEVIGLLPSISKVIRKFDFLEQRLSITRDGPEPGMYLREAVTLVRKPAEN
jgi:hypothetical protein